MDEVEVVVAHQERAALRVGGEFLKIDASRDSADREVQAMAMVPVPTPVVLWRRHPVLALAALEVECAWLVSHGVLPDDLVARNRELALYALRERAPAFIHGDLQVAHVFVEGSEVTGILDWSEAGCGDPTYDLATLTLGHREHLDDVLPGYGREVDRAAVRGWWSLRSPTAIRWLVEHGFDPAAPGREVDVLRSQV